MKAIAVVVVLAAAGIAALSVASCSVHRRSDGFTCDPSGGGNECGPGRSCDDGFCVETGASGTGCPSQCTSCPDGHSCRIECSAATPCGNVQCPADFDCTVRCTSGAACGEVDCAQARSCDVGCTTTLACGSVTCGKNECMVRCSGSAACPTVDCATSCSCDVSCANPAACPFMACPATMIGGFCTTDGSATSPCSSTPPGCGLCF